MWYNELGDEFETEEEAREDVKNRITKSDVMEYSNMDEEEFNELDEDGDGYWALVAEAEEGFWDDYYHWED